MNDQKSSISVFIVDDERDSRQLLKHYLNNYIAIKVVGEAEDVNEAFVGINKSKPDLIFLDIQMPMGDGFSLLKKFNQIDFGIIFITSYNEYAINAIKFNALDYLLKPLILEELDLALEKALKHFRHKNEVNQKIENLLKSINEERNTMRIPVHINDKVKLIDPEEILYIEATGRYSAVTLNNGQCLILVKNLFELESQLENEGYFIRITKSLIINVKKIEEYSKGFSCFITMLNNQVFEVSRRRKSEVLKKLKHWINQNREG